MSPHEHRATMADIAIAAGVSRTTVSFVLNDRPDSRIPEATRARVLQAAKELDYRPQGTARLAHPRPSSALGVVTDIVTGPHASSIIRGMQDAALREGMPLLLIPTTGRAEDDRRAVASLLEHRVGAILHARAGCVQVAMPAEARGTPTVLVNCQDSAGEHPSVRPDEEAIARLEADALLILTDVDGVYEDFGTENQKQVPRATPAALRAMGLPSGSMGPKVEAVCRFVELTGDMAAIGRLEDAVSIIEGQSGTIVTPGGNYGGPDDIHPPIPEQIDTRIRRA